VNTGPASLVRLSFMTVQQLADTIAGKPKATLGDVSDALALLGAGGDPALLAQLVTDAVNAIAGGLQSGNDPAKLTELLSNMSHIDGSALKPATVQQAVAPLKTMYREVEQFSGSLNELVWGLAQKPGGPASVAQAVAAVWDGINASGGGLQPLLDLLAVKPGATVADVEVVWQALSDGSVAVAQLLSVLSGKPVSANPTAADVQAGLPVLIQAIVDESAKQLTTNAEYQALINALCSAPFVGMTGNVVNNVAKVGVWVNIVKQEIENLEANLKFAYDKTVENKTAIAGVVDRVTALEGAALSGEGVSQAVVDSLLARLDALEAENVAMKAELAQKIGESDIAALREQAAFAVDETQRLEAQDAEIVAWVTEKYLDKEFFERWENSIVDLFSGVYTNHNDLAKLVQDVMNAMNGPTATVQSITEMFWLLNDLLVALVDATGIDFPGGGK
jgi:hypothetical protein